MSEKEEPFDQLSPQQKQCAIDVTVASAILAARLPSMAGNKTFNDWLVAWFSATYQLPHQISRYALRHIGASLFATDWNFSVEKNQQTLVTKFRQIDPAGGADGQKAEPPG